MKKIKHLLIISAYCLPLFSCRQINPDQPIDKTRSHNPAEKKYTKIISDSTNILTDKIETLEVVYTVWGCACPNWIRTIDSKNTDTTKSYISLHFYIEAANKSVELPDNFDADKHKLKLTGQFYKREDYPQGTVELEEPLPKAKVFRYARIELRQREI